MTDKTLLEKAGFKCKKCSHYSPFGKDLVVNQGIVLCNVCNTFAPSDENKFKKYIDEIVDHTALTSFRKFASERKENLKKGMTNAANKGNHVSRPAFGYNMQGGMLIPAENSDEVREIFESFSRGASMNSLARDHSISVNGIKKILKNFAYIGKIKFDNQILQGKHKAIIDTDLFNSVQRKFEDLRK